MLESSAGKKSIRAGRRNAKAVTVYSKEAIEQYASARNMEISDTAGESIKSFKEFVTETLPGYKVTVV